MKYRDENREVLKVVKMVLFQVEHVATLMLSGTALAQDDFNAILAGVTVKDLKAALKAFITGPKSMAAHGNCCTVPYLDQI